jgi:hypothetical protein
MASHEATRPRQQGALFSPEEVRAIRASDASETHLARQYGVNRATIGKIRRRITYRNVGEAPDG